MSTAHSRTALGRAEFFLHLAEKCTPAQRAEFEAYVDASIIFARTALHRLKSKCSNHPSWRNCVNIPFITQFILGVTERDEIDA